MEPRFDPAHALTFDLKKGRVSLDRTAARVVVPADALVELCGEAESEATRAFAARIGGEIGRRVLARLPDLGRSSPEVVLDHLGGEWALTGLGSLGFERWGRALVVTVDESPFGERGDALLAQVLEGCLQRALVRETSVVWLGRDGAFARFVVVSRAAGAQVRAWVQAGTSFGEALGRLHREGGAR
jgi:hypothetical protein